MHEYGKRKVSQLSSDAIMLFDVYKSGKGTVRKTKLVRLQPREMTWSSTHVTGPIKYSQFLYKITPEGSNRSKLDFTGMQLEDREMTKEEAAELARKIREEDSTAWKYLAKAMEEEHMK
jgi:hypothetical protein